MYKFLREDKSADKVLADKLAAAPTSMVESAILYAQDPKFIFKKMRTNTPGQYILAGVHKKVNPLCLELAQQIRCHTAAYGTAGLQRVWKMIEQPIKEAS